MFSPSVIRQEDEYEAWTMLDVENLTHLRYVRMSIPRQEGLLDIAFDFGHEIPPDTTETKSLKIRGWIVT